MKMKNTEALYQLAKDTRDQKQYRKSCKKILSSMSENLEKRPITPPTNQQMDLIHSLSVKDDISIDLLDSIAEEVRDNTVALSVVQQIAREQGYKRDYSGLSDEMGADVASGIIETLKVRLSEIESISDTLTGFYRDVAGLDERSLYLFSRAVD